MATGAREDGDHGSRVRVLGLAALLALQPASSIAQHEMLTPPALPQVAALAAEPGGTEVWVLANRGLWRLDPSTGDSSFTPHPPLTPDPAELEVRGARTLPVFGLARRGRNVVAFLPGGARRLYRPRGTGMVLQREVDPGVGSRRALRDALQRTGTSHLDLWPEQTAEFELGTTRVRIRRRQVELETSAGVRVLQVPGITYRELMRVRPEDWGLRLDPGGGIGPFLVAEGSVWLGLRYERRGDTTGVGGILRLDPQAQGLVRLDLPEAERRPARALAWRGEALVAALGDFREGRWWMEGQEEPGETLWSATDAGLLRFEPSTGRSSFRPSLADPRGVEAPTALLVRGEELWTGMGSGLGQENGSFVLWGAPAEGAPVVPMNADRIRAAIQGPDRSAACGTYLWLRRVRMPGGWLGDALVSELQQEDALRRSLAASACGWQGESACIPRLREMLAAPESDCEEMAAALALGRLGDPQALALVRGRIVLRARAQSMQGDGHASHGRTVLEQDHDMGGPGSTGMSGFPEHHKSPCGACPSLNGEGPGGMHSLGDALVGLGAPAVPFLLECLRSEDPMLREIGLGLRDMALVAELPDDAIEALRAASGIPRLGQDEARRFLEGLPLEGKRFPAGTIQQATFVIETLRGSEDRDFELLRRLLGHPVLGPVAARKLVEDLAPPAGRALLEAEARALALSHLVVAMGRRRDPVDLPALSAVLRRIDGAGWDRTQSWRLRRSLARVARYYGTCEGADLWVEAGRTLGRREEWEEALRERRSCGPSDSIR